MVLKQAIKANFKNKINVREVINVSLNVISFAIPQRLIFGAGAFKQVPEEALQVGAKKVLLLSDRPLMAELKDMLIDSGMEVLCFIFLRENRILKW